jgi:hypothetical protein
MVKCAIWMSLCLVLLSAGCGSDEPSSADDAGSSTTAAATESSASAESAIVGRWERVHACSELVSALEEAGLGDVAAPIVAGDYYSDGSVGELAGKDDLCEGAKPPFVHSHFFDASGRFGSLDESENQVDEGAYEVVGDRRIRIGGDQGVTFNYEIEGDTLMLSPVVTEAMVEEALANPTEITDAARAVAVAYPGQEWKRVPCKTWC